MPSAAGCWGLLLPCEPTASGRGRSRNSEMPCNGLEANWAPVGTKAWELADSAAGGAQTLGTLLGLPKSKVCSKVPPTDRAPAEAQATT
eukprot:1460898-Alexandrium_andersonii.AAC.1